MGLTFDDVLLVPQYTEIHSRKDVNLKTRLTKDIEMDCPIVSSNMDTVTEHEMMKAMQNAGGVGILHRFMSDDLVAKQIEKAIEIGVNPISFSVGISNDYVDTLERIYRIDPRNLVNKVVTVDVAHGACDRVVEAIKYIKHNYPFQVIAGNVATARTTEILVDAGADAIKVGIGNGSVCITRKIAGAGVPLLTSLMDCFSITGEDGIPLICDGGVRNSGDAIKALAAGASSIITGSLLSGTEETPGQIIVKENGTRYKVYRGMASKDAMMNWRGDSYRDVAAEGESTLVSMKGPASSVIQTLCAGVRSGMTYCNALNLKELRENAIFIKNTSVGFKENGAHLLEGQ